MFISLVAIVSAFLALIDNPAAQSSLLDAFALSISTTVTLFVLMRIGVFAATVMFLVNFITISAPLTFDSSRFYSTQSWLSLFVIAAVVAAGFVLATNRGRGALSVRSS